MDAHDIPEKLLLPWHWDNTDWVPEFRKEILKDHSLADKSVKSIARKQDNDDILFQIFDDEYKYALVHLTFSTSRQTDNRWPTARLYKNWSELYEDRMLPDSEEWNDSDEESSE